MLLLFVFIIFIFGLIVGSAINSFLWRYQNHLSYSGRSMCPNCKKKIAFWDNVPLFSWLLLGGKCRNCKKPISIQYPLVELTTGLLFTGVFWFSNWGQSLLESLTDYVSVGKIINISFFTQNLALLVLGLAVTTILIMISVNDYKTKEIPNGFNLAFVILAALVLIAVSSWPKADIANVVFHLISALAAFLFFYLFVFFSNETWMGGGDAKMAFGIGLLLGPAATFFAILVASVSGSVYGLAAIALGGDKKRPNRHEVPFGPFLALGTYIAMIFGPQIIDWYVRIILGIS